MTDLSVPRIILDQIRTIDPMALMAWGAKDYVGTINSIQFTVSGMTKWKGKVIVKLNGRDLYDVRFFRSRGVKILENVTTEDVYAEDLVNVIDQKVG